jgi:acetyl esterase/lipase
MRRLLACLVFVAACGNDASVVQPAPRVTSAEAGPAEAIDVVTSCTLPPDGDAALTEDLVYTTSDGQAQTIDVAVPKGTPGPHPVVLFVHGGGWSGGDKSSYHPHMKVLASLGIATATANYRLVTDVCDADAGPCHHNRFPAGLSDVRCAVRWLRANAARFELDTARFGAMGDSAGGNLVSMLGTAPNMSALDDGTCTLSGDASVSAVATFFGQEDLLDYMPTWPYLAAIASYLGTRNWDDDPERSKLASPITHVTPQSTPFLIVHGTEDTFIPFGHAAAMRAALARTGVPATLVPLRGVGHGFSLLDTAPSYAPSTCTMLAFFRRYLTPSAR